MYKAFQGANGWYVAFEDVDGSHWRPFAEDTLLETVARRRARERQAEARRRFVT